MKKLYFLTLLSFLFTTAFSTAQVVYNGNGNSGFGGPIGNSSMSVSDDGTTITIDFTKGSGDFNDTMVMYIDNGTTGRNIIDSDVNDTADANRRAISNTISGPLTFPAGFEATHAIAINTGFGGLWSIPTSTVGDNGLGYIDSVGMPASTTAASFTFSFDWAEIGLVNTDNFPFVITYGNPNDAGVAMFSSDEGYGTISPGNPGVDAFEITSVEFYPSGTLGIDEITNPNLSMKFYASDNNNLHLKGLNNRNYQLSIYDSLGRTINSIDSNTNLVDVSYLKKGIYFAILRLDDGNKINTKFLKQ